jgi:serine protease Do
MGSGIVLDDEGHILTNNHVVEGRGEIGVVLFDERRYDAELVGTDPKTDLAVIKIDAPDLHPLRFGDSERVEVGDWVIAVGAPFGLSQTVTHGIVSAKGRKRIDGVAIDYQDFIQTDAAINPGNSGGPLLNLRGEVVGVNTAIATRTVGNAGIAFTIPSNLALKIAGQLKETGTVRRGYLGILPVPIEEVDVEIFGLEDDRGVLVERVLADSPADRGGLEPDDAIVEVDGVQVTDSDHFRALVADLPPDRSATFGVVRDGRPQRVDVRLGLQPDNTRSRVPMMPESRSLPELGLGVRTLRPALSMLYPRVNFSSEDRGVVVAVVEPTAGEDLDLRPGELIVGCNGRKIKTVHDLVEAVRKAPDAATVRLEVMESTGDRRLISIPRRTSR